MARLEVDVQLRWSDMDAYAHVNNVEMLRLLEEARIEAFWSHPAAPDGTLFFGGSGGKLFQVSPKGEVSVLASGWPKIIGVAYDEANRRLFAAVGAADASSQASVRIVPLP